MIYYDRIDINKWIYKCKVKGGKGSENIGILTMEYNSKQHFVVMTYW